MEAPIHSLNALFEQLGLPSSDDEIQAFMERHRPLTLSTSLADAAFWNPSQADFLRKAIAEDADWVRVVEEFDLMLRR